MPNKKRALTSLHSVLATNFEGLFYSKRTWVMLLSIALIAFKETHKNLTALVFEGQKIYLSESVFVMASFGFNILLSTMVFLVMLSEIPRKIAFQNYILMRTSKGKWLLSHIVYCLLLVVLYMSILIICTFLFSIQHTSVGSGFSPILKGETMKNFIGIADISKYTLFSATCKALLPVFLFWFTLSLSLLLCCLTNHFQLGMVVFSVLFFLDAIAVQSEAFFSLMEMTTLIGIGEYRYFNVVLEYILIDVFLIIVMYVYVKRKDIYMQGQ